MSTIRAIRNTDNHKKCSIQDVLISFLTHWLYDQHFLLIKEHIVCLLIPHLGEEMYHSR